MPNFDPDAYLREFDPDAYLAEVEGERYVSTVPATTASALALTPRPTAEVAPPVVEKARRQFATRLGANAAWNRRSVTIAARRLSREERRAAKLVVHDGGDLPATRGDCADGPRPCPLVSCRWHLYLDVNPKTGAIKLNFPDREVEDLAESCALDVADGGGATLEQVAGMLNLTRERVRQIEVAALARVRELGVGLDLSPERGPSAWDEAG